MKLASSSLICGAILYTLAACQSNTESAADSAKSADIDYVKVNFLGKDRLYPGVKLSQMAEVGSIKLWEINAGDNSDDYLSLGVYGDSVGTYPLGNPLESQAGISIAKYQLDTMAYSSSKGIMCGDFSGLRLAKGHIKVEQFEKGKLAKGTFSGSLMPENGESCDTTGIPFHGEFYLTK